MLVTILLFVGLAVFMAWYFVSKDRGEREPASALWIALGFGALGIAPAMGLEMLLVSREIGTPEGASLGMGMLLWQAMLVGIIEELCKFVPLALFLYKKRYFNEHTDGILYFAIAGMGFGLPENILYTVMNGAQVGVGRLILTPFFHAATTALVGYFAARAKLAGRPLVSVWWAMLLAIGVHGMYDFGLFSQRPLFMIVSFMIASGLTGVLFVMAAVAKTRDQQYGLSAVGENTFCRTCGQPNAHKFLYCQKCGNRA